MIENSDFVKSSVSPRREHYFQGFELTKNYQKSMKHRPKVETNLALENVRQKIVQKMIFGGSWAPFGKGLGRSWASFGRFWAIFGMFKIDLFYNIGPRWAPRGLLDRFWSILGNVIKVLGGFGKVLGGFCLIFGWNLERFRMRGDLLPSMLKSWPLYLMHGSGGLLALATILSVMGVQAVTEDRVQWFVSAMKLVVISTMSCSHALVLQICVLAGARRLDLILVTSPWVQAWLPLPLMRFAADYLIHLTMAIQLLLLPRTWHLHLHAAFVFAMPYLELEPENSKFIIWCWFWPDAMVV